jgi:hypoxanthine phosphoribosyltransferase
MARNRPSPPLLSERRLRARVRALGRRIAADYRGKDLVVVGVLHGAFVFLADLVREIRLPLICDFVRLSSYGGSTRTSGRVRFEFDLTQPVRGRHVLVVEDIVDTGLTMSALLRRLRARRPASLRLCALLRKPSRERVKVPVDYLGFDVPDRFVVGYGLDHAGLHRNLRSVVALPEE